MHKKFHYSLGALCLILFIPLAVLVRLNYQTKPLDFLINDAAIQRFVFSFHNSFLTPIAKAIHVGFGPSGGLVLMAIFVLLLLIFKKVNRWWAALYLLAVTGFGVLVNPLIKDLVGRTRPFVTHLVNESDKSFPSGHSIGATLLIGGLFLIIASSLRTLPAKILLGLLASLIILSVMTSRVYLGVHYPSDTLAGLLLGLAILHLSYPSYYRFIVQRTKKTKR